MIKSKHQYPAERPKVVEIRLKGQWTWMKAVPLIDLGSIDDLA